MASWQAKHRDPLFDQNTQAALERRGKELVGAGLVGLAAMVLVRLSVVGGAVALTMTVPLLVGAAGFVLAPDSLASGQVAVAGVGVLLGSVACLLLPRRHRAVAAGPVVAGLAALLVGGLGGFASVPLDRAAALAVALPCTGTPMPTPGIC